MWYGKGVRAMGRSGVCLASVSSIVVLVGPNSAAAHEDSLAYQAGNAHFAIQLVGHEVPEGGDPDGQGSATLDLDRTRKQICFTMTWSRLRGTVNALHLNVAARGGEGPQWIDFFDKQSLPGPRGMASGCVPTTSDKIDAVLSHPTDYYLNLDSSAFTKGAIRGQLSTS